MFITSPFSCHHSTVFFCSDLPFSSPPRKPAPLLASRTWDMRWTGLGAPWEKGIVWCSGVLCSACDCPWVSSGSFAS
ncbi:hypothetical protein K439DRAFT_1642975 [Ramaria rubella]|nr:hypothetical protein K439DRAFT_1642975 [Ramaria rubella]